MAKKPLSRMRAMMMAVSNQGKGCIGSMGRREAILPRPILHRAKSGKCEGGIREDIGPSPITRSDRPAMAVVTSASGWVKRPQIINRRPS
jgi:hypothetical protein